MTVNFAKLITETQCLTSIEGGTSLEDIKLLHLLPSFEKLMDKVATDTFNAKLTETHIYRYKITVHAQKR